MRVIKLPRAGAWAFVSLLGVGGMLATYPGGAVELFRDLRDYPANTQQARENDRVEQDLLARMAIKDDRLELKRQLRGQLARGEVSLGDAAGQYERSLAAQPHLLAPFRHNTPGNSDEERAAAYMLREVFASQPVPETERQGLLDQFQSRYGTAYPFELPNPSAGLPTDVGVATGSNR